MAILRHGQNFSRKAASEAAGIAKSFFAGLRRVLRVVFERDGVWE
jgi:hypothetical protein